MIYGDRIEMYGLEAYAKFLRNPLLERFVEQSHEFSIKMGMLDILLRDRV